MSRFIYIASDYPLSPRPNPHEKMMSVNEALTASSANIPDFLLKDDFDKNKPVILVSDRNIDINLDTGIINDGDFDDDFNIWIADGSLSLKSDKKYFAVLEWHRLTGGRAANIIKYIADALENADEVELWHIWLGAEDKYHCIKTKVFTIEELTPNDIIELDKANLWGEMITDDIETVYDYRYIIKK
ncbi:MAG: hypothetical protein J6C76_08790 [Oscillospiraceae bacterium]|nr:hypothetical protein [Oscillospiraceae bacterium]